jgi:hypothetical protein
LADACVCVALEVITVIDEGERYSLEIFLYPLVLRFLLNWTFWFYMRERIGRGRPAACD